MLQLGMLIASGFVVVLNLDEAHSNPGLQSAAASGLAEECRLVMLGIRIIVL